MIGIACPDQFPLLAFVSLFAPAVVRGNTIVIIPSETAPLSATDLYQVGKNVRERQRRGGRESGGSMQECHNEKLDAMRGGNMMKSIIMLSH